MNEVEFDSAFTFKYSPRRGTKAIEYDDQVSEDEKQERLLKVIELQKHSTRRRNKSYLGKVVNVLIEKRVREIKINGLDEQNLISGLFLID